MSSSHATLPKLVESKGIYHGLPTYPPSVKGHKALVFGANGISGNYMLRVLSQAPERWEQVTAVSRRPPDSSSGVAGNVKHIQIDLLKDPKDIAQILTQHQIQA
jgi:nucleoside-diphosphate-sugar epimerase